MNVGNRGLDIIKEFEGWSSEPYLDPVGIPTIGWGSTWDDEGSKITIDHEPIDEATGERYLRHELRHVESAIARLIKVPLTQNQFDAMASFAYNVGTGALQRSTLRMKLNRQDYENATEEFQKWKYAGGRVLAGLVRRRAAERALFLG